MLLELIQSPNGRDGGQISPLFREDARDIDLEVAGIHMAFEILRRGEMTKNSHLIDAGDLMSEFR